MARIADRAGARARVTECFALRLGLAATVALALVSRTWGVPNTIGLFELAGSAIFLLAFHFPTVAATEEPLARVVSAATDAPRR